ncbi:NAD-dependent epimerase/dehydratase family protein [Tenggerimyces flavus]|uniref:NAD-dependent epimerase/dehydratase family protein n=1 Tax=Tenggerimyces flavus TaxID=1708749 RepID=A0ABV7YLK2_9ACTN|nr:NAD-dependent epimerase/dehydratase family protein [Tenggerimyces flavus]MBM7785785.1 dTDP-L-rhamnose 4-epimerase [Tenggerimyces flavus]
MRFLVTGGRGFIGRHIVEALESRGHEVVVLDRVDGLDIRDADAVKAALRGVDVVCHQAAKVGLGVNVADQPAYASHNDVGTATLLAAMASVGVRRLVLASSMVVYGEGAYACALHGPVAPPPRHAGELDRGLFEPTCPRCGGELAPALVDEGARLDPRNAYAASKVAQEHYASAWARETGGSVIALRYHNVYGPGLPRNTPYAGVAALFASAVDRGEAPRVFEDGKQRRDFVHVRDVAAANVCACQALVDGMRAYNVGSGTPRTIHDLAAAMSPVEPVVTGEYRLGDVRHITASSERIARDLGWSAEVPFADGIAELSADLAGRR